MKIVVAGTGYVGLVTGVAMAEIGHNVTCVDVDSRKVETMRKGISPIYEQDLEELMKKNKERIHYTVDYKSAYRDADVIFIGVGTPEREDGSANLDYVFKVCEQIAQNLRKDAVVVVKSTVPIGTNDKVEMYLNERKRFDVQIHVASNPEFLAQGTAVRDTLYASRIVVGTEDEKTAQIMKEVYEPLTKEPYNVSYLSTNRRSAEMIKYASNDFLALKISYINEIANLCELLGADIEDVARGMSFDSRIGNKFLNAGIGYGGSCFPKDTKALHWLSSQMGYSLLTVKAGIEVNKLQKLRMFEHLLKDHNRNIEGLTIAVLGATFKPGTDDLREAPSITNVESLLEYGANVRIYDPVGLQNFSRIFKDRIEYCSTIESAIIDADAVLIMTEWPEIKNYPLENYIEYMRRPLIYDGRNCYELEKVKEQKKLVKNLEYTSIGRKKI